MRRQDRIAISRRLRLRTGNDVDAVHPARMEMSGGDTCAKSSRRHNYFVFGKLLNLR
jgi:hypothetical protein